MFCQQCGTQIEDGLAFCTTCGAKQLTAEPVPAPTPVAAPVNTTVGTATQPQPVMNGQYVQPNAYTPPVNQQGYVQQNAYTYPAAPASVAPKSVSFGEAIKLFFVNYVNFNGRATLSEYWYAFLFNCLVSLCVSWIPVLGMLVALGLMLPGIAVCVRRLHDTGKSWVYMLMGLIPIAGAIILIIQLCKPSEGDNQWGPVPVNE